MLRHRRQLVRLVADATIVRDRDPSAAAHRCEPLGVRRVVRKVVGGAFDTQAGGGEDGGKLLAEIAVGEENPAQAARS